VNRLTVVSGTTYRYTAAGSLKTVTYPNDVVATYNYNDVNRLTSMTITRSGLLAAFNYNPTDQPNRTLARTGHRRGVRDTINIPGGSIQRDVNYDYDRLYRLTREEITIPVGNTVSGVTGGTITYDTQPGYSDSGGFDRVGNRRSRTSTVSGVPPYSGRTFDANDREFSSGFTFEYDANGNTRVGELLNLSGNVAPSTASAETRDQYDHENRLIRRSDGTTTITLVYDGDGNRARKTITSGGNTTVIRYLVDDRNPTGYAQVLEEWKTVNGGTPSLERAYVYGHDLISQRQTDGTIHYYGYDGHGSTRLLINSSGAVTDAYSYDAFGILIHQWAQSSPTPNSYLYAGEQWDAELGMYFLRARYMNPNAGRFWTMDFFEGIHAEPLSLHKYLYCHADPVNNWDSSGYSPLREKLTVMSKQAGLFAMRFYKYKKAFDKSYTPLIYALVLSNLGLALTDDNPSVAVSAGVQSLYQFQLLNTFRRKSKRSITTIERAKNLLQLLRDGKDAASLARHGVQMKPTGYPNFTPHIHKLLGTVPIWKLKGTHRADKASARKIRKLVDWGPNAENGDIWHHHEVVGIMQLVPKSVHKATHRGGALLYEILTDTTTYSRSK
jgi:RHS repeat-associated protein